MTEIFDDPLRTFVRSGNVFGRYRFPQIMRHIVPRTRTSWVRAQLSGGGDAAIRCHRLDLRKQRVPALYPAGVKV
jgi:hypothetical protein